MLGEWLRRRRLPPFRQCHRQLQPSLNHHAPQHGPTVLEGADEELAEVLGGHVRRADRAAPCTNIPSKERCMVGQCDRRFEGMGAGRRVASSRERQRPRPHTCRLASAPVTSARERACPGSLTITQTCCAHLCVRISPVSKEVRAALVAQEASRLASGIDDDGPPLPDEDDLTAASFERPRQSLGVSTESGKHNSKTSPHRELQEGPSECMQWACFPRKCLLRHPGEPDFTPTSKPRE